MRFFFYGTLMDPEVLDAVIGRRVPQVDRQTAIIEGFRRVFRLDAWYPVLVPARGERISGILVDTLSEKETDRLIAFEGNEYVMCVRSVSGVRTGETSAQLFLPRPGVPTSSEEWTLQKWRLRHRQEYLRRVRCRHDHSRRWR